MKKIAVSLMFVFVLMLLPAVALAKDPPPEPEPPKESSSLSVTGECFDGAASYTITNGGGPMLGPSTWYQSDEWSGGASSCAANVASGHELSGTFTLSESASIVVPTTLTPGAICVAQRPLHPGVGWTHAAIVSACEPPPPPVCSNHPEWAEVPDGWMQLEDGTCIEKPEDPQDQCPDLEGFQPPMPPNWYVVDGLCVEDLCLNLDGVQVEVPEGMQEKDGICLEPTALLEWPEPGMFVRWKIFLPFVVR